jgi:hypothetical protein
MKKCPFMVLLLNFALVFGLFSTVIGQTCSSQDRPFGRYIFYGG